MVETSDGRDAVDRSATEHEAVDPVRAEIERYLREDETRLGDVYRGIEQGLDADGIAESLGIETSNFVWNYTRIIRSLLDRSLPTAPTVALQVARRYRTLLKHQWSPEARDRLAEDLETLEQRATDVDAIVDETESARERTEQAEEEARTGIYVYALPHYLRYPFDPETGRTLMKVGRSDRSVIQRMREQTRTTALPEEPVLLRIYETGDRDTAEVESRLHRTLRAVHHGRTVERMAGREWFLTSTRAIDALADLMGLEPTIVNSDADPLDDT